MPEEEEEEALVMEWEHLSIGIETNEKNYVQTARYTLSNFLPITLFDQLKELTNLYFFIIGLLQMIPTLSVTGGLPAMWLPLSQVILVVSILEGYNDWKRHKSDDKENSQKTQKFEKIDFKYQPIPCRWEDLRVGSLVLCTNRETSPADILLLATSRSDGRVMIETSSLDGETNLKFRLAPHNLVDHGWNTFENVQQLKGTVMFEKSNASLDSFEGSCSVRLDDEIEPLSFTVGIENLLLRGCKLRNTEWAIGVVIYVGHKTKIYKNALKPSSKGSILELKTQKFVILSFSILILICFYYSFFSILLNSRPARPFLVARSLLRGAILRFVSWNLLIVNIIPISIFFFLNISRAIQALLTTRGSPGITVRNDRLNSDLGLVRYIFTDKTGTLTRNYMTFKALCINGISYEGSDPSGPVTPHVDFWNTKLNDLLLIKKEAIFILLHMAINHAVLIDDTEWNSEEGSIKEKLQELSLPIYSSSSAEEGTLVYAAAHLGYQLISQKGTSMIIDNNGNFITVTVLCRFEFDSQRRRSSILIQMDQKIILFTKGADSVVKSLLKKENHSDEYKQTFKCVETYARRGLRTLCLASRELEREFALEWLQRYDKARNNFENVESLVAEMERDLVLQGAVGVEDELVEGVELTIEKLRLAGIQFTMLTGDKCETAINIGQRTKIVGDSVTIIEGKEMTATKSLEKLLSQKERSSMVIEGKALQEVLNERPELVNQAVNHCDGVVVCRATPQQKALVVGRLRSASTESGVTLAIGDGGNDCQMIQAANVGIGIRGSEGLQAFNVSDFGIDHFGLLQELLLVHGRFHARRLGRLVFYSLAKMLTINAPQSVAGIFSLLTPQRIFAEAINQFVNPVFSALAPVVFAVLDYAVDPSDALKFPETYSESLSQFSFFDYVQCALSSILQGVIAAMVPLFVLGFTYHTKNGEVFDLWGVGSTSFFCALFLMTQKLDFECSSSLPITFLVNILSALSFFAVIFAIRPLRETAYLLTASPMFYFCWGATFFLGIFRDYAWKVSKHKKKKGPLTKRVSAKVPKLNLKTRALPQQQYTNFNNTFGPPDKTVLDRFQELLDHRRHTAQILS